VEKATPFSTLRCFCLHEAVQREPHHLKTIFERCSRAHYEPGNPNKKLGLGLSMARALTTAHKSATFRV
jgi:hypothetical protein